MARRKVEISHPDKVLFPDIGLTKADMADYYRRIAEYMLPHIRSRPLTMKRYTEGVDKDGFFNKHAPDHFPDFIDRLDVPMRSKGGETMQMASADEVDDLVYLAGQDVVEIHTGLSTADDLERPDQIIFDFDPSDGDFGKVRKAAFGLRGLLDEFDVGSFVKTSGSRGVHVHIPLKPDRTFDEVKKAARKLAEALNERHPDLTTLEMRKNKRGAHVFVDYLRNDYGMTSIAPYSLRAVGKAPVATPIDWSELKDGKLGPQSWTCRNIFRRLSQKEDPWRNFYRRRSTLPDALV